MTSYAARDSSQFWLERIRSIYEILNSMHEHGGFTRLCSSWNRVAKKECVGELDKLVTALSAWKRQLEREFSPPPPLAPVAEFAAPVQQVVSAGTGRLAPQRAAHLRAVPRMRTLR